MADNLQYVNDAKELWQELEDRYDQTNGAKLYQLQKEINDLSQGSLDITGYYTKMKKLWEELNTLNIHAKRACKCTCGARENIHKVEQDRRLIQFLMGLNEVYTIVRGSILMMNPLPTIAQAFSILIQEEKQREVKPSISFSMDSAALNVSGSGNSNFRTNYNQQENNNTYSGYKGNQLNSRPRPFCDYCKMPGFNKGRRIAENVFGPSNEADALKDDGNGPQEQEQSRHMHSLTKEQYGQLLTILESFQGGVDKSTSNCINGGAVNFAGISACSTHFDSSNHLCDSSNSDADTWILDSGATNHMTHNKSILTNVKTFVYPYLVILPNGYKVKVTLIGDVILSPKFSLKKVLFVPSFKFNLISVHSLTVQLGCIVVFTKYICILLQGPSLKRPLEIGKAKTGLYLHCSSNCNTGSTLSNSSSASIPCFTNNENKVDYVVSTSSSPSSSQLVSTSKLVSTTPVTSTIVTPPYSSNRSSSLPHSDQSVNSSSNKNDFFPASDIGSVPHSVSDNTHHEVSPGNLSRPEPCSPPSNPHNDDSGPSHSPLKGQTSGSFPVVDCPGEVPPDAPQSPTVIIQDQGTSVSNQNRPSRTLKIPAYLKDFECTLPRLQQTHQNQPISPNDSQRTGPHECEPSSYEEAAVKPAWQAAMNQEFQALYANKT
ncbi:PREDICTED: uncharacterized protein LOC109231670 [Nicotiana attenuata]|uniref:uncharacterized protein LOC109231670 n=1 Tax=Nicotiana attenuata TaxID=49451 RepID=UPI0009049F43|nr:PREDICTED: uncharacterized protein LOC109231670 [Nicotiana attenuata]